MTVSRIKTYCGLIMALAISASPFLATPARADFSECAVHFLRLTNSARAAGMGGCAINLVDQRSALHNPGALGLYHSRNIVSVSVPRTSQWLPAQADDLLLKTYSVSGGVPGKLLYSGAPLELHLGMAYSRQEMQLGEQVRTDEFGNLLETFGTWEKADLFTLGVGMRHFVRVGLGLTYKIFESHLGALGAGQERGSGTAEGSALDLGLLAEFPLLDLLPHRIHLDRDQRLPLAFEFTPSFAYVYANLGDDISYIDAAQADPIPKAAMKGISLYGAARVGHAVLLSARLSWQEDQSRVGTTQRINYRGAEYGLLGIAYIRQGRMEDLDAGILCDTRGYGISLGGLLSWLNVAFDPGSQNRRLRYLLEHFDVTYDHAEYETDIPGSDVDGTEFVNLSFSF